LIYEILNANVVVAMSRVYDYLLTAITKGG